jgi:hypothetical protein
VRGLKDRSRAPDFQQFPLSHNIPTGQQGPDGPARNASRKFTRSGIETPCLHTRTAFAAPRPPVEPHELDVPSTNDGRGHQVIIPPVVGRALRIWYSDSR